MQEQGGAGKKVHEQGGAGKGVRESLGQILTWSAIFGDVALVTNSPYFNTAVAIGKECLIYLLTSNPYGFYFCLFHAKR